LNVEGSEMYVEQLPGCGQGRSDGGAAIRVKLVTNLQLIVIDY
jgi:hypothetical protein